MICENMSREVKFVAGLFAIACFISELDGQTCSKFDVASIKVNTTGEGGGYPELASGGRRVIATGQHMIELFMFAYGVAPLQISGLPSAFLERYDIEATCEQPMIQARLPHLLQLLLEERFHLAVHRELREQLVYALIVGKGGPRFHETSHEGDKPGVRQSGYTFTFTNATMANLIDGLSQVAGRKVLDKTGLRGHYDFTLGYAPDRGGAGSQGAAASDRLPESVFTALREELGLDLEPQRSQIEFIVVDHIDRLVPN
jgi:uncharacterized protein (TIGR03435 family)